MKRLLLICLICFSCNTQEKETLEVNNSENETQFIKVMQKHLDAVSNKDLATLKSTMSPTGEMQLILPQSEIQNSVDAFMKYHEDWFAIDNGWTFETKILNTKVGETFGMAITEVVYREPERNGVPYFNRMIVSYDLEKINGTWYIVKDHASSIEKSTDKAVAQANTNLPDPFEAGWKGKKVCEILEDNDVLRVLKCTFPPGVGHEKHEHQPHFGYTLVGGTFKIEDKEGTREVNVPTGYSWTKNLISEHKVLNIGTNTSQYLIVEPK